MCQVCKIIVQSRTPQSNTHTQTWYTASAFSAADGSGLQSSLSSNAIFLKASESFVPSYLQEFQDPLYVASGYVDDDYVEELDI